MHSLTLSFNTVNNVNAPFQKFKLETPIMKVNAPFQKFKLETPIMKEISNIKRGWGKSMPEFIPGDC